MSSPSVHNIAIPEQLIIFLRSYLRTVVIVVLCAQFYTRDQDLFRLKHRMLLMYVLYNK